MRYVYGKLSVCAISDKSQIFQLARALSEGENVIAEIAPAFVGQFGDNITPRNIKAALRELGFSEVYEVALGADIGAMQRRITMWIKL